MAAVKAVLRDAPLLCQRGLHRHHTAAGHSKAAVLRRPLIKQHGFICGDPVGEQTAAEGAVIHQRIRLPCMILHIRVQNRQERDFSVKVDRCHFV